MNFLKLNAKWTLLALMQLSVLSCNKEDVAANESDKDGKNLKQESIHDGPKSELQISRRILSSPPDQVGSASCKTIEETYNKTFDNFSKLGAATHLLWPGNIVQGGTIVSGNLASIPIDPKGRNTIEVKVDAFSSSESKSSSKEVENPTAGKVQDALEKILNSYYTSGTKFPANYAVEIQRTYDSKQLQVALGVGYTGPAVGLSASLGLSFKKNKTYYAVTLKQKFFNVSVSAKPGLQGDFGWIKKEYPRSEFDKYIGERNPAAYISSVTYGRLYTLVYESDESSFDMEQALNFAYKNPAASITVDQKLKYSTTLQNTKVYAKQLGGSASGGLDAAFSAFAGNFEKVRDFVVNGADVSKDNPGYPIEYTAVNIESNLDATINVNGISNYSECEETVYTAKTLDEAKKRVEDLKTEYGYNSCAKIIIFNNTDREILLKNYTPWSGSTFSNLPPTSIPAGRYGYLLAVNQYGTSKGTYNQISYLFDNKTISFGTYAPVESGRTNNVLVNFREITETELNYNSTRPSIEKIQDNIRIRGTIESKAAPYVNFTITGKGNSVIN
ncbi:thiol-activated cytolysin [Flavobacterium columnare]|uniref:thiol-activated cytolysin family protein n=1 Tax=Flavobacterium columnare TaxID=996 RepID=UPI0007F9D6AE|nr:thiol-activated cytolysin family protein [Flavobacterium columnare]ANO49425.1 thiol-activated cytolysin [Flavobacterium columnare]APT22609.1 thiol-activated cytolysin [Flavobacterium columnare]PDS22166.1 thiol-activated cytolysin [Flavobacterium columnare] [Flavobacterium columnare NBRC 100251 = ATCC 23463]QOG90139.1 thiol-activated cytolysin family protein [Flavobacterium columnare]QOG92795.1 thiol-activated cytolysin family protein [Flavobacterium columnare]